MILIAWTSTETVVAWDWAVPKLPDAPSYETLLKENGLQGADEKKLLEYVLENEDLVDEWLPRITEGEEAQMTRQYGRLMEPGAPRSGDAWKKEVEDLTLRRLHDKRRIVDAALRQLGKNGSAASLAPLMTLAASLDQPWAKWKVYASVQEILEREDPEALSIEVIRSVDADAVAPLLRDLSPKKSDAWASALWDKWQQWLSPFLDSKVDLTARLWLARFFASRKPDVAAKVFREGLASRDAATRTLAEMLLRQGVGGSVPHLGGGEALVARLEAEDWKPAQNIWEVFPKPLERPFVAQSSKERGRKDLVWLDSTGKIVNHTVRVWPTVMEVLPNGLFFSRIGDRFPALVALTNTEGEVYARYHELNSSLVPASHGGGWCLAGPTHHATEFAPDGTILWQMPVAGRMVVPSGPGRIIRLGYRSIECCDRRGDVLWTADLRHLDDPRYILPVGEDKFLLACGKSVGWLTKNGEYTPLVEKLGSPKEMRYHPNAELVVFDGANSEVVIYDPQAATVTGRIDLDDNAIDQ